MSNLERVSEEIVLQNIGHNTKKRTVAVVVAENEMSLKHRNLSTIVNAVKLGVRSTQNNAAVFTVPSICDDITAGTAASKNLVPMRNLVADIVESYGSLQSVDGFVFVANQPLTIAGMLIGALRVNKPSLFISGGYMPSAVYRGNRISFNESYLYRGKTFSGELSAFDIEALTDEVITSFACPADSYDANSGSVLVEALGLALEGNSTVAANSHKRAVLARKTGEKIIKVLDAVTPRMIVNEESLTAALSVDLAMGSSSTSILNILALAKTVGLKKFNYETISELAKRVPHYFNLSERTQSFMDDFALAGGVYGLLMDLVKTAEISMKYATYANAPMGSLAKAVSLKSEPIGKRSPLRIVNGGLAEDGAVSFQNEVASFAGKAKVFDSQEEALDAIVNRSITKGDVVVIRNEGPTSCPGMREVRLPLGLLVGLGLDKDVALITDGRIQNISRGIAVGNISPESGKDGSLLHLLMSGDPIAVDFSKGKITVDVPAKDLAKRKKVADSKKVEATGCLAKYALTATSAEQGALSK